MSFPRGSDQHYIFEMILTLKRFPPLDAPQLITSDIRRKFMMNEITLEKFKTALYKREIEFAEDVSFRNVDVRFARDAKTILLTMIADATPLAKAVTDLKRIVESTNARLPQIANAFGSDKYRIGAHRITGPPNPISPQMAYLIVEDGRSCGYHIFDDIS